MLKRISLLLVVWPLVIVVGSSQQAQAEDSLGSCTQCSNACNTYCDGYGTCAGYSVTLCSEGQPTCTWTCTEGQGYTLPCTCNGSGSPIFKKKPAEPLAVKKKAKLSAKPVQPAESVQQAKPTQSAKPVQPATVVSESE